MASAVSRKRRGGAPRGEGPRAGDSNAPRKRVPGLASPAGESPGACRRSAPLAIFAGDFYEPGASRRGRAGRTPQSHNQETPMFQTKVTFAPGQTPEQRKAHAAHWRREDARRRAINNVLGFWRVCGKPPCRRNRTCSGDMHACFTRHWPAVPEEREGISARLHDGRARRQCSRRTRSTAPASRRATSTWMLTAQRRDRR